MVKKRQPDLDFSTSKSMLKGKNSVTLRDNKVSKKKQSGPRSEAVWAEAAKDLLFGGKALNNLRLEATTYLDHEKHSQSSSSMNVAKAAARECSAHTRTNIPKCKVSKPDLVIQQSTTKLAAKRIKGDKNPAQNFLPVTLASKPVEMCNQSRSDISKDRMPIELKARSKKITKTASQSKSSLDVPMPCAASREDGQLESGQYNNTVSEFEVHSGCAASDITLQIQKVAKFHELSVCEKPVSGLDRDGEDQYQHICASASSDGWIVAFTHRVELRGLAAVTLLQGLASIHGYLMRREETVNAYSPSGYFNSVIENETDISVSDETCITGMERWPAKYRQMLTASSCSSLQSFLSAHRSDVAVVYCKSIRPAHLQASLSLLSKQNKQSDFTGYIPLSDSLMVSKCQLDPHYSDSVRSAVSNILHHQQTVGCIKLVVCGGKDMGKSTFLRYIANRLLSIDLGNPVSDNIFISQYHFEVNRAMLLMACCRVDKVAILDCDPGQTEFTPPGTLSLNSVSKPLLGPPWCRLSSDVDHIEYYGSISADADPDKYMRCIRKLVEEYQINSQYRHIPLVVNTMGWRQGLGLEFLSSTVVEVLPSHVMQLGVGESSYRNFPLFSKLKVLSHSLFTPKDTLATLSRRLTYEVVPLLMEHVPNLIYSRDLLKADLLRQLMLTSYFIQSSSVCNIYCLAPYKIKFDSVAIHLPDHYSPVCQMPAVINGQVVAVCTVDRKQVESARNESGFLTLVHPIPAEPKFLGYGLVRAVDPSNNLLYVTTPLSPASISKCNLLCLVTGAITSSLAFMQQIGQVVDDQQIPYFGGSKVGVGTGAAGDTIQTFKRRQNPTHT